MARVSVTVCDICGEEGIGREVHRYTITSEGVTARTWRCDEHAASIDAKALLERTGYVRDTRATFEDRVATIEEIEARKRRSRRRKKS